MKIIVSRIPLPISGLALALASLGSLLGAFSSIIQIVCSALSCLILLAVSLKVLSSFKLVLKEAENPVIASVLPTFSMTIMSLSGYFHGVSETAGILLWLTGVFLHLLLMGYYTFFLLTPFSINKIFPSTFIPYVGIAVASVMAPVVGLISAGTIILWFGGITFALLLPVITFRFFIIKKIPEPALPVTAVFAAPASLLLSGYLGLYTTVSFFSILLIIVSTLFTIAIVIYMILRLLRLPFYPSYAAFGFPIVISAIAMKKVTATFISNSVLHTIFQAAAYTETVLAVLIVFYICIRYFLFMSDVIITIRKEKYKKVEVTG